MSPTRSRSGERRPPTPSVTVRELLEPEAKALQLRLTAGKAGFGRSVHLSRVQRPGLALTGYTDYIRYGRVQIVGASEVGYLRTLPPPRRTAILDKLCRCR